MFTNRSAHLLGWLLTFYIASAALQATAAETLATVTATQQANLPTPFSVRLADKEVSDLSPELLQWVTTVLDEQGVEVTDNGTFSLFITRIKRPASHSDRSSAVTLSMQGGSKQSTKAEVAIRLDNSPKTQRPPSAYGFEGRLEGPAGASYWRFSVVQNKTTGTARLTDQQLLQAALAEFGRSGIRPIHTPPE